MKAIQCQPSKCNCKGRYIHVIHVLLLINAKCCTTDVGVGWVWDGVGVEVGGGIIRHRHFSLSQPAIVTVAKYVFSLIYIYVCVLIFQCPYRQYFTRIFILKYLFPIFMLGYLLIYILKIGDKWHFGVNFTVVRRSYLYNGNNVIMNW